jgi:putative ABC transport system permease protein
MKKTQILDALRNIGSRRVSFFALFMVVLMGYGGFLSAFFTRQNMSIEGKSFYEAHHFKDFEMLSPEGMEEKDVDRILQTPGVSDAEGVLSAAAVISGNGKNKKTTAVSVSERISVADAIKGTLPRSSDECVLDRDLLEDMDLKIGDKVTLHGDEGVHVFRSDTFKITGVLVHPDYLRREVVFALAVLPEAFDSSYMQGHYTSVNITASQDESLDIFSEEYFSSVNRVKKKLQSLSEDWILLDRHANAGYLDYCSTMGAVESAGWIFGSVFLIVISMVCVTTISMILEEQKKIVGITRAFGFRWYEIARKYLIFGLGAAVSGCLCGFGLACLMEKCLIVLLDKTNLYQFRIPHIIVLSDLALYVAFALIGLCAAATLLSCAGLFKKTVRDLVRGEDKARRKRGTKKRLRYRYLYLRLMVRNMFTEWPRILLSILIIMASVLMTGTGITVDLAYEEMNERQLSDVYRYDLIIRIDRNIDASTRKNMKRKLKKEGTEYISAVYETRYFQNGGHIDPAFVVCADDGELEKMIHLEDPLTGNTMVPDDEGILVQYRIAENLSLQPGDSLTLLDKDFHKHSCSLSGYIQNYQKRMIVMSREVYEQLYGEEGSDNCFLVRLNGADEQKIQDELLQISEGLGFERADYFLEQFRSISVMYHAVVFAAIVIAILMSFIILTNLSNMSVMKRKTEIIILKINGFRNAECVRYMLGEIILTVVLGLMAGVAAGIPVAGMAVRAMETPDVQFVREIQPHAWIAAAILESVFAFLIHGISLHKITGYEIKDMDR